MAIGDVFTKETSDGEFVVPEGKAYTLIWWYSLGTIRITKGDKSIVVPSRPRFSDVEVSRWNRKYVLTEGMKIDAPEFEWWAVMEEVPNDEFDVFIDTAKGERTIPIQMGTWAVLFSHIETGEKPIGTALTVDGVVIDIVLTDTRSEPHLYSILPCWVRKTTRAFTTLTLKVITTGENELAHYVVLEKMA